LAVAVPPLLLAALDVPAALELALELLLLLPHPASANSASMAATARIPRDRGTTYLMLTALLSSKVSGRASRSARSCAHSSRGASCMQDGANGGVIAACDGQFAGILHAAGAHDYNAPVLETVHPD
jgi:hypothetical protein